MEALAERVELAIAVAVLVVGALVAWSSANAVKRVVGVVLAQLGALLALAVLGAPGAALVAAVALALAQLAIGGALLVRLQEAYGGVEAAEFDAADADSEPREEA